MMSSTASSQHSGCGMYEELVYGLVVMELSLFFGHNDTTLSCRSKPPVLKLC